MSKRPDRARMVGWFDPGQLLDTGLKALVSSVFGRYSDRRALEALARPEIGFHDYTVHYRERPDGEVEADPSHPRAELWLDYTADLGDGWNSTYAVARALTQPELTIEGPDGALPTRRGEVLVFGGDEVYPAPSRQEYERRLVGPYAAAFGDDTCAEAPHVFAIPGNHDWYDGLIAWSRLFCSEVAGRRLAGWRTRQTRSYFALKLPAGWWLLGVDGQVHSDIDSGQMEYFRQLAERHMRPGERVILCLASPSWVYAEKYQRHGGFDESDLLHLIHRVLGPRQVCVKVFVSGDLHHYRRHEELQPAEKQAPVQKITAGGGGAFLHPTHDADVRLLHEHAPPECGPKRRFSLVSGFPTPQQSRRLVLRNLLFAFHNPLFGIVPATLYLIAAWTIGATLHWQPPRGLFDPLYQTARAFRDNPSVFLVFATILGAFVFFTDTHSRAYKWVGGLAHAFAHYAAIFYIGWGAAFLVSRLFPGSPVLQLALGANLVFWLGWGIGSFVVGLYLLISFGLFGRHSEEAFSSLRIEDFKHFLRLHVAADGTLTIYPIGIERVARRWRARRDDERLKTPSAYAPFDRRATAPRLIEAPIVLRPVLPSVAP